MQEKTGLTEQQVREIIKRGRGPEIAFLEEPRDKNALSRLMQQLASGGGGHLILGVDTHGRVRGIDADLISQVVEPYLVKTRASRRELSFSSQVVDLGGKTVVVITLGPLSRRTSAPRRESGGVFTTQFQAAGDASEVAAQLAVVQEQLERIQAQGSTPEQVRSLIEEALATTRSAVDSADILSARLLLPPQELTDTRLVPAHSLDRLEEYHSDASWSLLLVGAFAGALLGFFVNWATMEQIVVNRFSWVLLGLLFLLLVGSFGWWFRMQARTKALKRQMLEYPIEQIAEGAD